MMSNGQDHNFAADDPVSDRVGEASERVPTRALADRPSVRRPQDQIDRRLHVSGEPRAQSLPLLFVPKDTVPKIRARLALKTVGFPTLGHGGPAARPRSP